MTKPYTLIRSSRLSLSLQIKEGGQLVVRAPFLYPKYMVDNFVNSKYDWINKKLKKMARPKPEITNFCSQDELKSHIAKYLKIYSKEMDLYPQSIKYKQVRTYWGSCSPTGVLSFNLRLTTTSLDVVEYVVVHELSHLRYRGHGKKFWGLVRQFYPKTNEIRQFLRQLPRDTN